MKTMLSMVLILVTMQCVADPAVTVPWSEFQTIYSRQVGGDLRKELDGLQKALDRKQAEPIHVIHSAFYQLRVMETGVSGQVTLEGQVLQGRPAPVSLFGEGVAIIGTGEAKGATLVTVNGGYQLYLAGDERFKIVLQLEIPIQLEHHSKGVSFHIPRAVTNRLQLSLPEGMKVPDLPKTAGDDGYYYFPPRDTLSFRLEKQHAEEQDILPLVDIFSRIMVRGGNYLITGIFSIPRGGTADLPIRLPKGHRFISSTLKGAWIKESGPDGIVVSLPREWQGSFSIDYEVPV
ncbi:MAG: hypothetical protein GY731_09880, partial [Gammaproteobacteria bacterium]|nr:hypothetical protein [Gammaproteobacteria bacterium]